MSRFLKLELGTSELGILTEVMCSRGCSMEDAARWIFARYAAPGRFVRNDYQKDYMKDWRAAKKLGIGVYEYRKTKGRNVR